MWRFSEENSMYALWVKPCTSKRYVQVLTLSIWNYDLIWKQGFCSYNHFKMGSYWIRLSPNSVTGVLTKRRKFGHSQKAMCWDTEAMQRHSDGNDAATSQGTPNLLATMEARKRHGRILPEGAWLCQHLDFDFSSPDYEKIKVFILCKTNKKTKWKFQNYERFFFVLFFFF